MSSEAKFAKALMEGFLSSGVQHRLDILNRKTYVVGDGTAVALDDHVLIPERLGGPRAGQWAVVVKLTDEGLGVRFQHKVGRVTREFFEWNELAGARATAAPREFKIKTVSRPRA
jgi:hypothetical protein